MSAPFFVFVFFSFPLSLSLSLPLNYYFAPLTALAVYPLHQIVLENIKQMQRLTHNFLMIICFIFSYRVFSVCLCFKLCMSVWTGLGGDTAQRTLFNKEPVYDTMWEQAAQNKRTMTAQLHK